MGQWIDSETSCVDKIPLLPEGSSIVSFVDKKYLKGPFVLVSDGVLEKKYKMLGE